MELSPITPISTPLANDKGKDTQLSVTKKIIALLCIKPMTRRMLAKAIFGVEETFLITQEISDLLKAERIAVVYKGKCECERGGIAGYLSADKETIHKHREDLINRQLNLFE